MRLATHSHGLLLITGFAVACAAHPLEQRRGYEPPVAEATATGEETGPPSTWKDEAEYVELFDGATLEGFERVGGQSTYSVEEGEIVGRAGPGPNTFLRTRDEYRDFVLRVELRFDVPGNSGIQFRSHQKNGRGTVFGYQCEVDPSERRWSAGIYDEGRRGWIHDLKGDPHASARAALKLDDWNEFVIRCRGNHIETWLNDVPCADLRDDADREGFIALQVHTGGTGQIRWRRVALRELDVSEAEVGDGREGDGGD